MRFPLLAGLSGRRLDMLVVAALTAAAAVWLLLLTLPGKTVATQNTWDLMFFLEAADRVLAGQVPNRDFHSPMGPLSFVLPALGLSLAGDFGGMLPVATALFTCALLPLALYACVSRLPPGYALGFGLYVLILTIAPAYIGDFSPKPTFGMFYNRWGYALVSLLFLFALPPRAGSSDERADVVAMAALWLLMFYLKMTYAAIGGVFLLALVWFAHSRRAALAALVVSGIVIVAVELIWGATFGYLGDLRSAAAATGAVRGGLLGLFATVVNNVAGIYLFAAAILVALLARVRFDYLLLALYMGAVGIMLDRHNAQGPGLLTFIPGALVALLAPRREPASQSDWSGLTGALLVGALAFPVAVAALGNLAFHFLAASAAPSSVGRLAGLVALDAPTSTRAPSARAAPDAGHGCDPVDPAVLLIDSHGGERGVSPSQYVAMAHDGARLLAADPRLAGAVLVFDLPNPFNSILNRRPPVGVDLFYDAEVTISDSVHPAPADLLRDVSVVMLPRHPIRYPTFDLMRRVYGPHLRANYVLAGRSPCWDAYARRR